MPRSTKKLPKPANPVKSVFFRCAEQDSNHYKFWAAYVDPSGYLYVERGRIGCKNPAIDIYEFATPESAIRELETIHMPKRRKNGYQLGDPPSSQETLNYAALGATGNEIQQKINHIQQKIEQIKQYTNITFDAQKGAFTSQCGFITSSALQQAKQRLELIRRNGQPSSELFKNAVLEYIKIVPIPVGRKLDTIELLGTQNKVVQQLQVLETLEWGLQEVQSIRQLIQTALKSQIQSERSERSSWMVWGDLETMPPPATANRPSDHRSVGMVWE
jgi:hypothetical protein